MTHAAYVFLAYGIAFIVLAVAGLLTTCRFRRTKKALAVLGAVAEDEEGAG